MLVPPSDDGTAEPASFDGLVRQLLLLGVDVTAYARAGLMRRVGHRMDRLGVPTFAAYQEYLDGHGEEVGLLAAVVVVKLTRFFRDPDTWDFLGSEIIPRMLAGTGSEQPVRIWCAGCASGEEAYSLAMLLAEELGMEAFAQRVRVFATDLDELSLVSARRGRFNADQMSRVTAPLREKYFRRTGVTYTCWDRLRRSLVFARHDVLRDMPIGHLDLVICRNMLMYYQADAQREIRHRLHYSLNAKGYLFLGKVERPPPAERLFARVAAGHPLFGKVPRSAAVNGLFAA